MRQQHVVQEKPWKAYFVACFLYIFFYLLSILSVAELPVIAWFQPTLNQHIIRWAIEICKGKSFNCFRSNHSVFKAPKNIIAHNLPSYYFYQLRSLSSQKVGNTYIIYVYNICLCSLYVPFWSLPIYYSWEEAIFKITIWLLV